MRRTSLSLACLAAALVLPAVASSQTRRAITVDNLLALHRINDPRTPRRLPRRLHGRDTRSAGQSRGAQPVDSPAHGWGTEAVDVHRPRRQRAVVAGWLASRVLSSRDGAQRIYLLNLTGGEPTKLTTLDGGANQIVWAPDGKSLAFTSSVWPDCADDACNKRRSEGKEKDPVKARAYDGLLYRHWTAWSTGQRAHLFVVPAGAAPRRT